MQLLSNALERQRVIFKIRNRLQEKKQTLEQAISERDLYFRVSLVGTCNLSCPFCHNEGAPLKGRQNLNFVTDAIKAAHEVGFQRVQFTGGEPLLHFQVAKFVEKARSVVSDVGITTNGTLLKKRIDELMRAGLGRLHISLQVEPLRNAGKGGLWGIPNWLKPMLDLASEEKFLLRLNMPVPVTELDAAKKFLELIASYGCDIKVFSILPEGKNLDEAYPIEKLQRMVDNENIRRGQQDLFGRIYLRGYLPPAGIRCQTCIDFQRCKEQSHSLRLGADQMLRPCLATRVWDSLLTEGNMLKQVEEATLLALDYQW